MSRAFRKGIFWKALPKRSWGGGDVATLWSGKSLCGSPRSAEAGPGGEAGEGVCSDQG